MKNILKRKNFSKEKKDEIKSKFGGKCAYCGSTLERFHVDHKKPLLHRGTHDDDNLVPACVSCNLWKSAWDLEGFRDQVSEQIKRLNDYSPNYKLAKRYGLIEEKPKEIVFYFEKINQDMQIEKDKQKILKYLEEALLEYEIFDIDEDGTERYHINVFCPNATSDDRHKLIGKMIDELPCDAFFIDVIRRNKPKKEKS